MTVHCIKSRGASGAKNTANFPFMPAPSVIGCVDTANVVRKRAGTTTEAA